MPPQLIIIDDESFSDSPIVHPDAWCGEFKPEAFVTPGLTDAQKAYLREQQRTPGI